MRVPIKVVRVFGRDYKPKIALVVKEEDFDKVSSYFMEQGIFNFVPNEGAYDTESRYFFIDLPTLDDKL